MSRGLDDAREQGQTERASSARTPEPAMADRAPSVPTRHLDLPQTDRREDVKVGDRTYQLRASEVRILATVGTFRAVAVHDLEGTRSGRDIWRGDLQRLSEQGLIERSTTTINHQPTAVATLTREGRDLLESHRRATNGHVQQNYHTGLVKPRELGHDAQLYRVFQAEAAKIEGAGGRIDRVVVDYELKREYQRFLNRPDHGDHEQDMRSFAEASGLPIIDDHLELPDLRIEYESADGRLEHRDVELVTEHYSRGQLAGKARAGFAMYRAGGGSSRHGGTPLDPHHLEGLL